MHVNYDSLHVVLVIIHGGGGGQTQSQCPDVSIARSGMMLFLKTRSLVLAGITVKNVIMNSTCPDVHSLEKSYVVLILISEDHCELINEGGLRPDRMVDAVVEKHFNSALDKLSEWRSEQSIDTSLGGDCILHHHDVINSVRYRGNLAMGG